MGTRVQGAPGEDLGFPGPKNKSRFPNALGNLFLCLFVSMFSICNGGVLEPRATKVT